MSRCPKDANALQAPPHLGPRLSALVGQAKPQRAVRIAEAEVLDRSGVIEFFCGQVAKRLGGLLQGRVVVGDDL